MRTYATILPGLRSALRVGVCLLLSVPAYAVDTLTVTTPDPVTEAWRWTEFDRGNGLIGRVRDVYEDRDGAIWFATDRGVNRYSGHGWTSYSPPYRLAGVSAVYQTRDGQMWFGTLREGIHRFDPKLDEWTTYTRQEGLGSNQVSPSALMQARDGTLWAGHYKFTASGDTETTISRFDGQSWSTLSFPIGPPIPGYAISWRLRMVRSGLRRLRVSSPLMEWAGSDTRLKMAFHATALMKFWKLGTGTSGLPSDQQELPDSTARRGRSIGMAKIFQQAGRSGHFGRRPMARSGPAVTRIASIFSVTVNGQQTHSACFLRAPIV